MTLNLLDSAEVMAAYEAVLSNELDWFLLHYPSNTVDTLALYAFGSDGLEELKTKIDPEDDDKVVIGFLRVDEVDERGEEEEEEEDGGEGDAKYVLVSYIPKGVLGVRRARAQVHTRRLGMIFKKHDAVLTADDLSQLTNAAIAQTLVEPDPSILTFHAPTGARNPSASPTLLTPPPLTAGSSVLYISPSVPPPASQQQQPAAVDMGRSFSQPPGTAPPPSSVFIDLKPVKRSYSEMYMPPPALVYNSGPAPSTSPPAHHKLGSNMFSNLLRRKKRAASASMARDIDESQESEDSMPPPTPPKDKGTYAARVSITERRGHGERKEDGIIMDPPHHHHHNHHRHRHDPTETEGIYTYEPPFSVSVAEDRMTDDEKFGFPPLSSSIAFHRHQHSVSEFAVISHEEVGGGRGIREDAEDVVVVSPDEFGYGYDKPLPSTQQVSTLTRKGKWAEPRGLAAIRDPAERARMRIEMQREKEEEEREALRAEEERQERRRREKEEFWRREEEEAEKRRAAIQSEAMRVAAERRRREEEERREEERAKREREARKRMERQKRQEEHRRLEEWRKEQQRAAEDNARMEEAMRKREEEERKKKIMKAEGEVKKKAAKEGVMTGWVTVQTDESVVWKRRFYKVMQDTMYLFRTEKEMGKVMDTLHVRGSLRALKEPKDGYEDLKAIPFSFAVEFHDQGPWAMFTDTEEEKFKLLGLLHHAAQLDL